MKSDIEMIESIRAAAVGSIGDELMFSFPEVLKVIEQCSLHKMAVLGVEINKACGEKYQTEYLSTYEVPVTRPAPGEKDWVSFVQMNNTMAEDYIRQHPTGDDHFYLLATSSWREFCEIQRMKKT